MADTNVRKATMRALVQDRYGPPDVLEVREVPTPSVGPETVLVRVRAASANPLDWHFMRAKPFFMRFVGGLMRPKQPIRGVDVSGVVEAVGEHVTRFGPGDEVFGACSGAFAEFVAGTENDFVAKPERLNFEQAAAIPIAAITALQGLRDLAKVERGQKVLIIGASGGVGTFAVQIAKALGAEVTGVSSTRNLEMVRSLGADHMIDYTKDELANIETRYDVIFQLAGTDSPGRLRRLLTDSGTLVLSSGAGRFSGIDRVIKALATSPFVGQRFVTWVADEDPDDLQILATMASSGEIVPIIDRTYDLDNAAEAIAYVEEGHTQGKVVVTI